MLTMIRKLRNALSPINAEFDRAFRDLRDAGFVLMPMRTPNGPSLVLLRVAPPRELTGDDLY